MDRARKQIDRKESLAGESVPEENPLAVHFLESLAFVTKIQNAVVKKLRTTLRMFFAKFRKTRSEVVAGFRHCCPPSGNLFQVVFFTNTQGNRSVDPKQLLLQIAGFSIKRRTKISRYFAYSSVRFGERRTRKFKNVRGIETGTHCA